MASRIQMEDTLERYYQAWTRHDHDLYRTIWAEDAAFADPPTDEEVPPTGVEAIIGGMDTVWAGAEAITYERLHTWHCGHSVGVHCQVTMKLPDATATIPLLHVFRFAEDGRIRRLEAFLDFELLEMLEGDRPDWMHPS
jgi:hypothetical protein